MKNIIEALKSLDIAVPEDKVKPLNDLVAENYRTINDYNAQKGKLDTAKNDLAARDKTINELNAQLESAGTDAAELENMRKTIADYKQAEEDRKAAEKIEAAKQEFAPKFAAALGERKFANDFVANSVREQAFKTASENPAMDVKQIVEGIVKDQNGIFLNPQLEPNNMPRMQTGEDGKLIINTVDDVKKLTQKEINENWEQVSKILAQK